VWQRLLWSAPWRRRPALKHFLDTNGGCRYYETANTGKHQLKEIERVLILVAIIAVALLSVYLIKIGDKGYSGWHLAALLIGILGLVSALATSVVYAAAAWSWMASEHKTAIINREYGTSYTREEVFFASDVIKTVRQLDRKRLEVNGDLLRDKTAKP
jgi:hypothetical protein